MQEHKPLGVLHVHAKEHSLSWDAVLNPMQ